MQIINAQKFDNNINLHFSQSDGYSAPIHKNLINELEIRGWNLIKEIGRGSTNVAFLAKNGENDGVVLIPVSQEYSDKNVEKIMELQKQNKLKYLVSVYDYFYTKTVVDKEDLKKKIEDEVVMYPDFVDDNLGYNIIITELLSPLQHSGLSNAKIIKGINEALTLLTFDGWGQTDLHLDNFLISKDGQIKVIDIEGIVDEECEFLWYINKLKTDFK